VSEEQYREIMAAILEEKIGERMDLLTLGEDLREEEQKRREASRALPSAE
jgi:hypothetical protein